MAHEKADRTWIVSITSSSRNPANAFEGWSKGVPDALVVDGDDRIALVFDDAEPKAPFCFDERMSIVFDDAKSTEQKEAAVGTELVYFDERMADRVVAFIKRACDAPGDNLLLVNCHAGVSRSGAIADAARVMAGVDFDSFSRANPQIVPNAFVRRLMRDAHLATIV